MSPQLQQLAPSRLRTALHEASHSVAAVTVGRDLLRVSIVPRFHSSGVSLGRCITARPGGAHLDRLRESLIALAGPVVENLVGGIRVEGASPDLHAALHFAGGDVHRVGVLYTLAQRLVREHFPAVRTIARELLTNGGLDGRDVQRAVRCAR